MGTQKAGKTSIKTMLGYGAGYLADSCFWQFNSSFQLVFLTTAVGMSTFDAGTVSSFTMLTYAIGSIFIGKISDNIRSPRGRRRPIIIIDAFLLTIFFTLMYRNISNPSMQLPYYLIVGTIYWIIYSSYYVAYFSLGSEVASDYEDRIVLNSYTRIFNISGNMITTVITPLAIAALTAAGMKATGAWGTMSIVFACVVCLGLNVCYRSTNGCERMEGLPAPEKINLKETFKEFGEFLKIKPYRIIIYSKLASAFAYVMYGSSLIFYITNIVGINSSYSSLIYLITNLANFSYIILIAKLAKRFGKTKFMTRAQYVVFAVQLLLFFIGIRNIALLIVNAVFYIFGQAAYWQLINANLYDVADLDEYRSGKNRAGNLLALQSAVSTAGSALIIRLHTWLLSLAGFNAQLEVQPDSAMLMLRVLYSLVPAVAALAVGLLIKGYHVEKEPFDKLKESIERRRAGLEPLPEEDIALIETVFQ